jgi:RimJ/RimL family protein N-acetyltransferase
MSSLTSPDDKPFVPPNFEVPRSYETEFFRLRTLTKADVDKDYEAVMASAEVLRAMFGNGWPSQDFSHSENLEDLAEHEQEFEDRIAFAYTVRSLDEQQCLGCVYINPPRDYPTNARIYLWARPDTHEQGLEVTLFREVKAWLEKAWPFERVLFPGRREDGSWYPLEGRLV